MKKNGGRGRKMAGTMKQRSILGEHLCTTIQGHLEPARGFGLSSARVRLLSFTRLRDPPDTMLTHGVAAVVRTAQSVVKRAALTSALRRAAIISSTSEEPNVRRCSLVAHSPVRAYWAAQRMPAGGLESCLLHARRFSVQKAEARVGDGYEKGQVDSSTELAIQAPFGHDSNDALARQLGIFKVYEYEDGGRLSRVTVAFQSRAGLPDEVQSIESHMALDNVNKLKQIPGGDVRGVKFPDDVTRHFRDLKVPFAAEVFSSNTEGVSDTLVFGFETPGGFWTIGWHVPQELFTKEPDLFFLFLQTLRLSPRDAGSSS